MLINLVIAKDLQTYANYSCTTAEWTSLDIHMYVVTLTLFQRATTPTNCCNDWHL